MAAKAGVGGKVHAYEPVAETFQVLEFNARLAEGDGLSIVPKKAALSAASGAVTIRRRQHSTHHQVASISPGDRPEDRVSCVSLADEFRRVGLQQPAAFVKIDVEGHELPVLQGSVPLLRARAIKRMIVEVTPGPDAQAIAALIADANGSVRCWLEGGWRQSPLEKLPVRSDVLVEF
jgi:FkbM family methyltransferase